MGIKHKWYRIRSLWFQYQESTCDKEKEKLILAMDRTIQPEKYRNLAPEKFEIGQKIKVAWTVCESILLGKRRHRKEVLTVTGKVIAPMYGDDDHNDDRVRIEFDEKEVSNCPLCYKKVSARLGFRVHPDDLRRIE